MKSKIFQGLNKNIFVLSITSLLTDISSEMLYPIIPIFLTSVLGAPMSVVGLIEGVAESTASVLKAFSGRLSDIFRKRGPFVTLGYFLSSLGKLILVFAYVWPTVLIARFIDRFGKGVRTAPRDAMIADSCQPEFRGKAFGFHRAADTIGACLGPLLALLFLVILKENLRLVFLISFIPAILGVLVLLFLKEPARIQASQNIGGMRLSMKGMSADFKKFLLISSIFALGNSSDAFLIMRSKDIGLSLAAVILAYVVYNISYSLLSFPMGILSDRIPRKWVLIGGYLIFALVYISFGIYATTKTVWILFFIYGFYMAMTDGVGKAFISDTIAPEIRGSALGIYYCVTGILALFASLIAGALWTYVGVAAPFVYGAFMAIVSCVIFIILMRR